jgi:hypothetical protein
MLHAISQGGGEVSLSMDGRELLVHPGRDVAYCMPKIARVAISHLDKGRWRQAVTTAQLCNCSKEEIGNAFISLVNFINSQPDELEEDQEDTMAKSLERVGFLTHSPAAQVLALAYFAQPVLGMFWKGARDAGARPQDATYRTQLNQKMAEAIKAFREIA